MRRFSLRRIKKVTDAAATKWHVPRNRRLLVISATLIVVGGWLLITSLDLGEDKVRQKVSADSKTSVVAYSDKCSANPTFSCYKSQLQTITAKSGPQSAVALLKNQYSSVGYVKVECHQLMHVVGRAALAKYGDIADTYAQGDQFCWSGYYHGALEQLAEEKGIVSLVKDANSICAKIPGRDVRSFYYYNCVHGLGHGYMYVENGQLFKSLADCDSLLEDFDRTSCYGGVFMQNIMNEQTPDADADNPPAYLKADQPMYPCTALADKYKDQCYLMQTSYALQVEKYNFSKVFALCSQVEPNFRDTCYTSLGRDASGQSISDAERTRSTCLLGPSLEAQKFCINGAAKDFVSYFHADKQAKQLCNSLPADLSDYCLGVVKDYYASF
jgi:hypothetical protein